VKLDHKAQILGKDAIHEDILRCNTRMRLVADPRSMNGQQYELQPKRWKHNIATIVAACMGSIAMITSSGLVL
jgi:hypothetical protein